MSQTIKKFLYPFYSHSVSLYMQYIPFRIHGIWLFAHPKHIGIFQFLIQNDYENQSTKLFREKIKKNWVVVDLGAHVGYYSIIASNKLQGTGKVYSIEPDPQNYQLLLRNIHFNKLKNVVPLQVATADVSGVNFLYFSDQDPTEHRLVASKGKKETKIKVKQDTLDNIFKNQKVDFIKLDVQGYEYKSLKGGQKIINKYHPLLLVEFWEEGLLAAGDKPQTFFNFLIKNGYQLLALDEYSSKQKHIKTYDQFVDYGRNKSFFNILCTPSYA
jgi:FkbM family methyltransferase